MQYNSSQLVDYASNGRVAEIVEELRIFSDPNPARDGCSAMIKVILNYGCSENLLEFNARADMNLLMSMLSEEFRTDLKLQEIMKFTCEEGTIPHVEVTGGFWSIGIINIVSLEEGLKYQVDRDYAWKNVPFELEESPMIFNNCN